MFWLKFPGMTGLTAAGAMGPDVSHPSTVQLAKSLRFEHRPAAHMADPDRYVPRHFLAYAVQHGKRMPDPRGRPGASRYAIEIWRNRETTLGATRLSDYRRYVLEVVHIEWTNTIIHFKYYRPGKPTP